MKSLADYLPPEFAALVHLDWRKNEAGYWQVRDKLIEQYRDQWIGFADGAVIASGNSAVEVLHAAKERAQHPFMICVGREDEPDRIRRSSFTFDSAHLPEPLPVMHVEFRRVQGQTGVPLDQVIPDTGSDASILPWPDCKLLQLDPAHGLPGVMAGVGSTFKGTFVFNIWVFLDGQEYRCRAHADLSGHERILGRDVLNKLDILFRGPAGEVIVNP
jgi:hypothetical protein